MKGKILLLILLLIYPVLLFGVTGRLKGRVTDLKSGEPLIGANILVVGTSFGAATDVNGEYVIQNLNPGVYELKVSFIGYQTITISNVRVNADLTTERNFQLPAEGVQVDEIQVVAEKPLIIKSNTNANRITTSEDIEAIPVRGIDNLLALTAGVNLQDETIFIRGGRQDEVGFYLEGANITDPVVGGRKVTIIQDAVEEIQVQSGGYTAEYGGANAGIIYTQFKSGTQDYKASFDYVTDNISFKPRRERYDGDERLGSRWYGYTEFTGSISGPIVSNKFKFFGLVNYLYHADQTPQPYPGINLGRIGDATTGDTVDFTYPAGALFKNSLDRITGTGTLSLDFNPIILRLVGTYSDNLTYNPFSSARVAGNIANLLNQDRIEEVKQQDGAFSLKGTHILTPEIYYEFSAGYSFNKLNAYDPYLKDNFLAYGDSAANAAVGFVWNRRPPQNTTPYTRQPQFQLYEFAINAPGDVVAGYQKYNRESFSFNAALTALVGKVHNIKVGGEMQLYTIRNYSFGNEGVFALAGLLANPGGQTRQEIFINRGVNNYGYDLEGNQYDGDDNTITGANAPHKPIFAAAFIQDKIEYRDLIINIGVRYDYFDVDNKELINPERPEETFNKSNGTLWGDPNGVPTGLVDVPTFAALSPRLGFSFPVTDRTVFHAQYGKFIQQTRLRDIYQGWYLTSSNIGGGFFIPAPVGFNVRPTRTTQYEVGFTQQVGEFASFDITGYYKDIQDQVVYDQQNVNNSQYGGYFVLRNGDFATTKGVEISFNMRRVSRLQLNGSISFQDAQGTGSFPNSNRGIVGAPLDGVTRFKPQYISPLEYNNSFRGSLNLDFRFGSDDGPSILHDFGISALLTFNSGHPYTTGVGGANLEGDARDRQPLEPLNASTTPWNYQLDLRVDKTIGLFDKLGATIYLHVINLFDTRNVQNVFLRTGSADDDGVLTTPGLGLERALANPQFAQLYRAINLDYYEQWQLATTGPEYTTTPRFFGPPRQIRLGIRFEY